MDLNSLKKLNQPIGDLIETFVECDKEAVADIQAKLLAIRTAETTFEVPQAEQTDLFKLKRDDIGAKLEEFSVSAEEIAAARQIVDGNKGMPQGVPPIGLIAKMHGFVKPAICDALLTAQAGARTVIYATADIDTIPATTVDAVNDKLFSFVGKSDKEPVELQAAQSIAHLALIDRAISRQLKIDPQFTKEFLSLAHNSLNSARRTLETLGQNEAAASLPLDIPENDKPVSDNLFTILQGHAEGLALLRKEGLSKEDQALIFGRTEYLTRLISPDPTAPAAAPKPTGP